MAVVSLSLMDTAISLVQTAGTQLDGLLCPGNEGDKGVN